MRHLWLFPIAVFTATAAAAEPLTFAAAIERATATAPDIEAGGLRIDAARSAARSATALPDPRLQLGYDAFPVSGPTAGKPGQNDFSAVRVGIEQVVPNGAKRRARGASAASDIGVAAADRDVEIRKVRIAAASAWIDLYYGERKLSALADLDRWLVDIRQSAPARLASGSARPAQALEPEQLLAQLADRRTDLVAVVGAARTMLARWTGVMAPDVLGDAPSPVVDAGRLRLGVEDNPTLRSFDARAEQADAGFDLARADRQPDWSWQVGYQRRDPRFGDLVSAGVSIGLPLFTRNRQDPMIAARATDANRVRIEREAARRELAAQLDVDLADHVMHHERLARGRATLLPLAQRRADLEIASYGAGSASLGDAQVALVALSEVRLEVLNREADVVRDAVRLDLTYGNDPQ